MKLLVHMRDGRTVFRIVGRGTLNKLCRVEPWTEEIGVYADRGIWNPITGDYVWTVKLRLQYLAKGSIAYVEQDLVGVPQEVAA